MSDLDHSHHEVQKSDQPRCGPTHRPQQQRPHRHGQGASHRATLPHNYGPACRHPRATRRRVPCLPCAPVFARTRRGWSLFCRALWMRCTEGGVGRERAVRFLRDTSLGPRGCLDYTWDSEWWKTCAWCRRTPSRIGLGRLWKRRRVLLWRRRRLVLLGRWDRQRKVSVETSLVGVRMDLAPRHFPLYPELQRRIFLYGRVIDAG